MSHSYRSARPITKRLTDIPPYPIISIVFLPSSLIGIKATKQPIKFVIATINAPEAGETGNCPFVASFRASNNYVM